MVKLSASNPSLRISGRPTYSAPGATSDLSQSRALTGKLTKQHVLMVQETREPTGYPCRQRGEHAMSNGSPQSGFESKAFLLGGNSANQYSIIYSRTSPVTGITCWHFTFSTKEGYLKFVLFHFYFVLFRRHVYDLTLMSEGEVEGGFPAQQEKPKPVPKHNHKATSWKWNRMSDLFSDTCSLCRHLFWYLSCIEHNETMFNFLEIRYITLGFPQILLSLAHFIQWTFRLNQIFTDIISSYLEMRLVSVDLILDKRKTELEKASTSNDEPGNVTTVVYLPYWSFFFFFFFFFKLSFCLF